MFFIYNAENFAPKFYPLLKNLISPMSFCRGIKACNKRKFLRHCVFPTYIILWTDCIYSIYTTSYVNIRPYIFFFYVRNACIRNNRNFLCMRYACICNNRNFLVYPVAVMKCDCMACSTWHEWLPNGMFIVQPDMNDCPTACSIWHEWLPNRFR